MSIRAFKLMIIFGLFFSTLANAEALKKATQVLCRNQAEIRTVRVNLKGQNCQAVYTKMGKDQIVGNSGTADKCFEVLNRIKENLEKANWNCRDISESRISTSMEQ
jgi:hypothetical protein